MQPVRAAQHIGWSLPNTIPEIWPPTHQQASARLHPVSASDKQELGAQKTHQKAQIIIQDQGSVAAVAPASLGAVASNVGLGQVELGAQVAQRDLGRVVQGERLDPSQDHVLGCKIREGNWAGGSWFGTLRMAGSKALEWPCGWLWVGRQCANVLWGGVRWSAQVR